MIISLHQNSAEHREPLLAAPLFLESPIVAPVDASRLHRVDWRWVKGHAGDPGNERADRLANQGVTSVSR